MRRGVLIALGLVAMTAACGGGGEEHAGPTSTAPGPRRSTLEIMRTDANTAAKSLRARGYHADFTIASLKEVDRFFDDQLAGPSRPRRGTALEADEEDVLLLNGGYVGEVIRRAAGGKYSTTRGETTLTLPDGHRLFPVKRVVERYANGDEVDLYRYGRNAVDR